ncbi:cytidine deaminase, partial [Actinomadura sp. HBU206391]|nr:cytidine deaminase [Actinomadura sp. HBU206391]
AVVTRGESVEESDLEAVRDLGGKAPVLVAGLDGALRATLTP